jgi:fucose permease
VKVPQPVKEPNQTTAWKALTVLHPAFALTGILQVVHGALLPSLAARFSFSDSQSGLLLTLYFGGTAMGALLCRPNYGRSVAAGFLGVTCCCLGIAASAQVFLFPLFLLMGLGVGVSCSSVSLFVGRNMAARCAATLTFLNFTWSIGALAAPLLAAALLEYCDYRAAYASLAVLTTLAAAVCLRLPADRAESGHSAPGSRDSATSERLAASRPDLRLLATFGLLAFLETGVENTAVAWLTTYSLRSSNAGLGAAAAFSSLFWCGFLASRGVSSFLLLRVEPVRVLRTAVGLALVSVLLIAVFSAGPARGPALFLLGTALGPIFPLLLSLFFVRVRRTSDTRWILALSGFGGSILPWVTGWISTRSGSLRVGLVTVPAALLTLAFFVYSLDRRQPAPAEAQLR